VRFALRTGSLVVGTAEIAFSAVFDSPSKN